MITANDLYLQSVVSAHTPFYPLIQGKTQLQASWDGLAPIAYEWAGESLSELIASGSFAKGTSISGTSDLDMFISLKPSTPHTLAQLHDLLVTFLKEKGLAPRKQNVSIGLIYSGLSVDLTPGKRQSGNSNYHSIYSHKRQTWTQTNIIKHLNAVKNSGRIQEIKLAKIWKKQNNLDFPSHYLEMAVMEALKGYSFGNLSENFETVLTYFSQKLTSARFVDPSNSNNVISDDLTPLEKLAISAAAKSTLSTKYLSLGSWINVIW